MALWQAFADRRFPVAWFAALAYTIFMRFPRFKQTAAALLWMLIGAGLGYALVPAHSHTLDTWKQVRERESFRYINPLLECELAEGIIDESKQNFKNDLADEVTNILDETDTEVIAVYYRDLNNGPAFGVREQERFFPASLLKVPVMMAYFDASEDQPDILDRTLKFERLYDAPEPGVQLIPPGEEIVPGNAYPVREILRRSIQYSDNQAVTLLIQNLDPTYIRKLYRVLGVPDEVLNGPGGMLTVREYASFFRVLYNASYLDRKNSEAALEILAGTTYDRGLVAGVPKGIVVAHKFGETGAVGDHQIHDCGIVYHPRFPYLLCVMSRGESIPELESAIARVSRFVWEKVSAYEGSD